MKVDGFLEFALIFIEPYVRTDEQKLIVSKLYRNFPI